MAVATGTEHLQALRDDLAVLFPRSAEHVTRANEMIPGGNARSRLWFPFAIQIARGEGAHVWDIDDREYVDAVGAMGPMLLGQRHPEVVAAIENQLACGLMFGSPTTDERDLAARIIETVPGAESVIMLNSGTEATMAALRLARAATGKVKVGKFAGGWHGWHDHGLQSVFKAGLDGDPLNLQAGSESPGIPAFISDHTVVLPWNDRRAFDRLRREADDLACVITELIQGAAGARPADREFVQELRSVCDECNVLLVIDEVLTGFRCGLSGASGLYGVKGDLVALGKAVCGGLPGAAVTGRADLVGSVNEASAFINGTYSAHPLSMAAGRATMDVLVREQNTIYPRLFALGERLRTGLQEVMDEAGWGFITGEGPLWGLHAISEKPATASEWATVNRNIDAARALAGLLIREGVLASTMHLGFLSAAHSDDDIDHIITAHRTALDEMKRRGFID
jgi:glutamate-1-semialdehyde 2,1-aminomutase